MYGYRRRTRLSVFWSAAGVLVIALAAPVALRSQAPASDPVERLRETLQAPLLPPERRKELARVAQALDGIPVLQRALAVPEWQDDNPDHKTVRDALVDRFESRARDVMRGTDATRQIAVAHLLGEMGVWVTGKDPQTPAAAALAPELAELMQRGSSPVVEAAARSLGKVKAPPEVAVPALAELLRRGDDIRRAAAAEALGDCVQLLGKGVRFSPRWHGAAAATRTELVRTARAVLPAVARGLSDPHPAVRRQGVRAIGEAAVALTAQMGASYDVPRRSSLIEELPDQRAEEEVRKELEKEQAELRPLVEMLREQVPGAIRLLGDADPAVCLATNEALESLAEARSGWREKSAELARLSQQKGAAPPAEDPLDEVLSAAVLPLAGVLGRKEVPVRLAALYALETLDTDAAPAVAAVLKASQDDNSFVRWGAARTLGRMAPREAARAVPGLARLTNDDNADVRLASLAGLERYGPATGPAVPELRRAVGHRDTATRVWALQALRAVGKEARPALPEVLVALSAPDAEVRLAAARVLGRVGPLDDRAIEALRKAVRDSDAEVRVAASEALLGDR